MANELSGRMIVYTNQVPYETDILNTNRYKMADVGWLAESMLGYPIGNTPVASKFICLPVSPPGLAITVSPGVLYQYEAYDATAYGVLPAVTGGAQFLYKPYINSAIVQRSTPAPVTPGNSVIHLVEVIFNTSDINSVSRPYFNSADPTTPIFMSQPDTRLDSVTITLKQGVEAPSPTPPTPDAGYTGLYYVAVTYGQTSIVSGDITVVPGAPFITEGLTQKISQDTADTLYQPLESKYAEVRFNSASTQAISVFPSKVEYNGTASGPNAGWWNGGLFRFIPNISGKFKFNLRLQVDSPTVNSIILELYKNGSQVDKIAEQIGAGVLSNSIPNGISAVQSANGVSDYFEVFFNSDTGGTMTVGDIAGNGISTLFEITYIGQ